MLAIVKGKAVVQRENEDSDDEDYPKGEVDLKIFHGVDDQSCFSDYMGLDLPLDVISGGYLEFVYDSEKNELIATTAYYVTRKLTPKEEAALIDYTQGQWSDGIGECFEQNPVYRDGEEYYISPWYQGQVATLEYKEAD